MNTEKNSGIRKVFKVVGPLIIIIGVYMVVVAIQDFMAADFFQEPQKDHYFFIAFPLLFVGFVITNLGYMRNVADYTAREMAPVAKDTINYMLKETSPGVKEFASAIKGDNTSLICPSCESENAADAKFCNECGHSLILTCRHCNHVNEADSKYCDQCGTKL